MRIEITGSPRRLVDLEALCRVAREQGFPDDAYVSNSASDLTVRTSPEERVVKS